MFEQDYIMRLIKETIRVILKLLFNIDAEAAMRERQQNTEERRMLDELLDMVDAGQINEAENRVYEMTESADMCNLEIALLFYSYLNDKEDAYLEEHNFSRKEIKQGVKDVASRYGLNSMVEVLLIEL